MFKRLVASLICLTFSFTNLQYLNAQDFSIKQLPVPGTMVDTSLPFAPLALKGMIVNPQKPLEFQFIVDTGKGPQDTAAIKDQANQLVKYFLAGLTIPEGDLWVNLSPYEKNRMVPEALGQTELGRDLLAQDYILKQLTASLIYPEKDLGKEFWSKVYAKAQAQFGTTNVPVNTFNKVWILPDQAQVYENVNAAYVTKSTLRVMLDEDYLAKQKHQATQASSVSSQVVREIVLPEIEKEVNAGKNFAPLRQIYQALILAKWYKETIQNDLLDAVYTNKNKVVGVNLRDPAVKEQIYERYLKAYKKGAFNYIKEDPTPDGQVVPKKYFSGGITGFRELKVDRGGSAAMVSADGAMMSMDVDLEKSQNAAMAVDVKIERDGLIVKGGQELLDFLGSAPIDGESDPIAPSDQGKFFPIILALGSPSPSAFMNAAKDWKKYKEWGFKDVPIIASTGRGRGYASFVLKTVQFLDKKAPSFAQDFRNKYVAEIAVAETQTIDELQASYEQYRKSGVVPPGVLTEAKVIAFLFEKFGGMTEEETGKLIKLEEISGETDGNIIESYNQFLSKFDFQGLTPKIQIVAAGFHRMRAFITAFARIKGAQFNRSNWAIYTGASEQLPLQEMYNEFGEQWFYDYTSHMIGNKGDVKGGEIGRLKFNGSKAPFIMKAWNINDPQNPDNLIDKIWLKRVKEVRDQMDRYQMAVAVEKGLELASIKENKPVNEIRGNVLWQMDIFDGPWSQAIKKLEPKYPKIAGMLEQLLKQVMPQLIEGQKESPVQHIAHVVNFAVDIGLDELERNKITENELKVLLVSALFHDSGFAQAKLPKITKTKIQSAQGNPQKQAELRQLSIDGRKEHMVEGEKLVTAALETYSTQMPGSFTIQDKKDIAYIVRHHDDMKIPPMIDNPDEKKSYLLGPAEDPKNPEDRRDWLLQLHWEADLLWMLSPDGIVVDQKRAGDEAKETLAQFFSNVNNHREAVAVFREVLPENKYKMYSFPEEGPLENRRPLPYRSPKGYDIFKKYRDARILELREQIVNIEKAVYGQVTSERNAVIDQVLEKVKNGTGELKKFSDVLVNVKNASGIVVGTMDKTLAQKLGYQFDAAMMQINGINFDVGFRYYLEELISEKGASPRLKVGYIIHGHLAVRYHPSSGEYSEFGVPVLGADFSHKGKFILRFYRLSKRQFDDFKYEYYDQTDDQEYSLNSLKNPNVLAEVKRKIIKYLEEKGLIEATIRDKNTGKSTRPKNPEDQAPSVATTQNNPDAARRSSGNKDIKANTGNVNLDRRIDNALERSRYKITKTLVKEQHLYKMISYGLEGDGLKPVLESIGEMGAILNWMVKNYKPSYEQGSQLLISRLSRLSQVTIQVGIYEWDGIAIDGDAYDRGHPGDEKFPPDVAGPVRQKAKKVLQTVETEMKVSSKSRGLFKQLVLALAKLEKGKDSAMIETPKIVSKANPAENGGIDLNQINVKRNGKTVHVQFDPAQLNELIQGGFKGFTPVIINITPIQNPFQLLGINSTKEPEVSLAKA